MELVDAMKTTGTCRFFTDQEVPDEVLYRAFDAARFGPQGGNRQPISWVVIRDRAVKEELTELYLTYWRTYYDGLKSRAVGNKVAARTIEDTNSFAHHLADIPVWAMLFARLDALHPTDTELGRLSIVGGASVYPTMQNFCLALRDQGVATAVTTLLCTYEDRLREMLAIPDGVIAAAQVMVGYPAKGFPTRLRREPVESFVYDGTFEQRLFTDTAEQVPEGRRDGQTG